MSAAYLSMNAWREILARVFDEPGAQSNISPDWLVNPATGRRLKLDYVYEVTGTAVRFAGMTRGGGRRRGDQELLEEGQRDRVRDEVCRQNGIQLAVISPFDEPVKQMDGLLRVLSRASRLTALDGGVGREKSLSMDALAAAMQRANQLRFSLAQNPERMVAALAGAWRDRETNMAAGLQQAATDRTPKPTRGQKRKLAQLGSGQRVVHSHFGDGVVTDVSGEGAERQVKILFDGDRERTFLASLVADKLEAVR